MDLHNNQLRTVFNERGGNKTSILNTTLWCFVGTSCHDISCSEGWIDSYSCEPVQRMYLLWLLGECTFLVLSVGFMLQAGMAFLKVGRFL